MTRHRFHILAVPHAVTTRDYSTCAFTQKIVRFSKMMRARGHYVIHYGHENSDLECDEHVTVTKQEDLERSYPGHDWRTQGFPAFTQDDHVYKVFDAVTIGQLYRTKRQGDFLLCPFGQAHQTVARSHSDMIVVEPGIGYAGTFAPFKVYESYAAMHALYGRQRLIEPFADGWYDAVIPNYFDLDDFTFHQWKGDYFLYLGRVNPGKGVRLAAEIAEAAETRLVVAGPGDPGDMRCDYRGVVGPEKRRELLSKAKAVICASAYIEPFCGVQIEAMLSGTPVISTDWGAFAEYNLHGVTGYRCRTREQFIWAARNIGGINNRACFDWAANNFSLERVGEMYEEYFHGLAVLHNGGGWNSENPDRTDLNWLRQRRPEDFLFYKPEIISDLNTGGTNLG